LRIAASDKPVETRGTSMCRNNLGLDWVANLFIVSVPPQQGDGFLSLCSSSMLFLSLEGFLSLFIFSFSFPSHTCKRWKGWSWASRPCICIWFLIKQLAMFWLCNSVCTV